MDRRWRFPHPTDKRIVSFRFSAEVTMRTYENCDPTHFTRRAISVALLVVVALTTPAEALELRPLKLPSLHLLRRNKCTKVAKLDWHTSYADAVQTAKRER